MLQCTNKLMCRIIDFMNEENVRKSLILKIVNSLLLYYLLLFNKWKVIAAEIAMASRSDKLRAC